MALIDSDSRKLRIVRHEGAPDVVSTGDGRTRTPAGIYQLGEPPGNEIVISPSDEAEPNEHTAKHTSIASVDPSQEGDIE